MRNDCEIFPTEPLVLLGCGGHARSVADVYLKCFPKASLLFVDGNAKPNETIFRFPVLSVYPEEISNCFLAIGNNEKRKSLWEIFSPTKNLNQILSPNALISPYAQIGRNVFIGNLAHIGPEARIGHNTIVNTGAIVEHEVIIGNHSHIGPNAVISGRCTVGSLVFIGAGAVVKDSIQIGSNIIVGAGAVVVKNLVESGVYVGCPAKLSQPIGHNIPHRKEHRAFLLGKADPSQ